MLCKIYDKNPNPKELEYVANILRDGGIIIYPTDTLYAIGCDALNVRAIEKVCNLKRLDPAKKYLSIVCSGLSNLSNYAKVNNSIFKLMKRNLPGPFTFILHATTSLPKIYKNRKEVGIRVPANSITLALVETLGNPILSTSLMNDHEDEIEYLTNPELIEECYGGKVDLIVDGGYGNIQPSTIVNCLNDEPVIVRQGAGELLY